MPVDPGVPVFTPRVKTKTKAIPPAPPGFGNLGGTFAPGGFIPKKPVTPLPPDQAPYKHGRSPDQAAAKSVAAGGEVKLVDTGAHPQAVQRAAQTKAMQRMLNSKGAHVAVDGVWGPGTEAAYQAYLHHATQYTQQAQQVDASRNPLFQQAPSLTTMHEETLLRQEAARRAASPEATGAHAPSGPELSPHPFFKGQQPFAHSARGDAIYRRPDLNPTGPDPLIPGSAEQVGTALGQETPHLNPIFNKTVEMIGGALPGVGLARAAEDGHLNAKSIAGEAINDLLWTGAAPFKLVDGVLKTAAEGADINTAARAAVKLWRDKKLARVQNPIIQRDLISSPDRQSFIDSVGKTVMIGPTEQHALLAVMDHNAITRAAQTGEKPSIAWGKANFGKSTFHDINPTREEALGALAQTGETHFQQKTLTAFPPPMVWDNPQALKAMHSPGIASTPFVSKLHTLVLDMPPKVGVTELLGKIKSAGIKQDEIRWNKFDEFLASATAKGQKSVTREEALGWLDKNYLQIEENRRFGQAEGYSASRSPNEDGTIFGQYTLPGGKESNYQEFTIRLPKDQYGDLYAYTGHFPDANILTHVRTTDRTVADEHTLMIEEIQSDWHQAGQQEGYKVPVTEHPDYEAHVEREHQAYLDVESIKGSLRRRITDALMRQPELADFPEHLSQAFERTAEERLGLNVSDARSMIDANSWMGRLDAVAENNPNVELRLEVVPHQDTHAYGGAVSHTAEGSAIQLTVNGERYGTHWRDGNYGVFLSAGDAADAKYLAEQQAAHLNNYLSMPHAERASVRSTVAALEDALRQQTAARDALRRLESVASQGVTSGPFAKTWHELAFKRMLAEAVDKGYARVAWTTGRTQAERYNLANFFKRIEVKANYGGSSRALDEWAEEMARNSVYDMEADTLGFDSHVQEELRQEAADSIPAPNEDDFYVVDHPDGSTAPAHPDDAGSYLDEEAYNEAHDEWTDEVDSAYERLEEQWIDSARESMIESETEYYRDNASEYDGPGTGEYNVIATDHNGNTHTYDASEQGSGSDNALENVIGPDLAQRFANGEHEFEGDNLVAGENAKSALGASHFYDNKLTGFVNKYLKQTGVQSTMEEIGGKAADRYEGATFSVRGLGQGEWEVIAHQRDGTPIIVGSQDSKEEAERLASEWRGGAHRHPANAPASGVVVHSIPITDEVRKFVDQGIVLFQKDPLVKDIKQAHGISRIKGAVDVTPGEKTKLHLFAAADVSTVVHELGHSVQEAIPSLAHLDPETFARSFERYFMTAKAPTENLVLPFADIREGMLNVYGSAVHVPGAHLTPGMKRALDAFFKTAEKDHPDLLRALTAIHFHPAGTHFQAAWSDHETFDEPKPKLDRRGKNRPSLDQLNRDRAMIGEEPQIERRGVGKEQPEATVGQVVHTTTSPYHQLRVTEIRDDGTIVAQQVGGRRLNYFTPERWKTEFDKGRFTHPPGSTRFQEEEPLQEDSLATTHEPLTDKTPEEILRAGMKGVPMRRGVQNKLRSEARAQKAKEYAAALAQGEGIQGHYAALAHLKGELPKIDFHGFKELDPEALDYLVNTVRDHPHLLPFQKTRLNIALDKATRGEMPTPSEQVLIEHVFGKDTARGLNDISSLPGHIQNLLAEILNVPRSVMASFDLSAPFRQGLVIGVSHPVIFFKNFPAMFKAFGSERVYQAVMSEVRSRPTYPMMVQAKLAITDMESLDRREEQFYSNLAERLTGGTRSPIRMSGRAYTGFLVKTRADVFDHLIRVAERQGHDVQKEKFLKDLGRFINAASGRGNLSVLQGAAPFLNTLFFSPRLLASRVDLLASPITYARADPFVRRQALTAMLELGGVAGTILGMMSLLPGVSVNIDPRNADFGKIRFGNTRIDILGGFQQPFRLVSQYVSGKIISSTTGDALALGPSGPGGVSRQDILKRFFEGKLAPVPSIINDWQKDTNFQGNKFSWSQEAFSHMIPLLAQDSADLYKREHGGMNGIALALGGYAVGAFGVGLQTYGPKDPAKKPTDKLNYEAKKAGMPEATPELLIDVKHQANLASLSQKHANDPQGRLDAFLKYYADETGDHKYDQWIGKKLSDEAAQQGADAIRHALVGPGLSQYEAAIRASLKAQGKKW